MIDRAELKALAMEFAACLPPTASEADPPRPPPPRPARSNYDWYQFNSDCGLPVLEQTPRARALRRIALIAGWRPWGQREVQRFLDARAATSPSALDDSTVMELQERMEQLETSAQTCCDPDEDTPAR